MSTPVQHPSLTDPNAWVPYRYIPSLAAAIIFMIIFAILTAFHIVKMYRLRAWFLIPFVLGGVMEVIGYLGRILSTTGDLWALGPYIMQSILLLIAPAFFAASIYMTLRRLIILVAHFSSTPERAYTRIPTKWISRIFVIGDVFAFLLQAGGGGVQAIGTLSSLTTGEHLIVAGLFVQVFFFSIFMLVAILFHRRANSLSVPSTFPVASVNWKRYLYMLYAASLLILIRSVFRVIEYLMGNDGYLLRHEYFLYIFDAVLMTLTMAVVGWLHPGEIGRLVKDVKGKGSAATRIESQTGSDDSAVPMTAYGGK